MINYIRPLLIILFVPTLAFAGTTGVISIADSNLQVISSPQIAYLYVPVTSGGCTYNTAAVLVMDSATNPAANAMYATLLAAKTTGKTVNITTSGCSAAGYPIMTSIYFGT